MTVSTPDIDLGPWVEDKCEVCGQPCRLLTAPVCPDCTKLKPGDRVRVAMERLLARVAAQA